MTKASGWWCVSAIAIGLVLSVWAANNAAEEKKVPEKHDASALNHSLRDVINVGAKMFNEQGDYAGCYRLYQGSLLSVRPFLAPDLQKRVDEGIGNAEKMGSYADRAFELRRVLDDIRASSKPAGKIVEKKDEPKEKKKDDEPKEKKKDDEPKEKKKDEPKEKKDDEPKEKKKDEPAQAKGQISGEITYAGKPIAGGFFVTLIGKGDKKFSSAIQKDGTFRFATPIPEGEYRVAIEPIPGEKAKVAILPPHFTSAETSGLAITVQAGKQSIKLTLVK